MNDIQKLETQIAALTQGMIISDRAIALRTMKLSGHLLDQRGYRSGSAPIDAHCLLPTDYTQPDPDRLGEQR